MGSRKALKSRGTGTKITAAHIAGLRPRPNQSSPFGQWDLSTAFVAGFAFTILTLPELSSIFAIVSQKGAPHSAIDLVVLLGLVGLFGIFPVVFLQHLYLQSMRKAPTRFAQVASALLALGLMTFATQAMKPIVGYDQKLAENRSFQSRLLGDISRSPASR